VTDFAGASLRGSNSPCGWREPWRAEPGTSVSAVARSREPCPPPTRVRRLSNRESLPVNLHAHPHRSGSRIHTLRRILGVAHIANAEAG